MAFVSIATFDPDNIDDFRAEFKSHFPNRNADIVVKNYWVWMTSQVKYEFVVDGVVYVV